MSWSGERIAVLSCIILIVILGVTYGKLEPSQPKYSLNLDRNMTYTNGNLSIVVANNGNSTGKILYIYGLGNKSHSTAIFSSVLATQTGKVINNLTLGKDSEYIIQKGGNFPTKIPGVTANDLKSGVYRGFLYLKNERLTTVPIIVATEPKIAQAIILVVIGVLASILFWEVFFFLNRVMNTRTAATLTIRANALKQTTGPAAKTAKEIASKLEQKAGRREDRAQQVENRYLINTTKIVSAEFGSVVFGILTGIVGLANNNYITNLVEINGIEVVVLFGIGLGIGSLKGLVDR